MLNIRIDYNPYLVKTEIYKDDVMFSDKSPLSSIRDRRLQEWIEPSSRDGGWKGIFEELKNVGGSKELRLRFKGTKNDFEDLEYARERYGKCFRSIELIHENDEKSEHISVENKIEKIKALYDKLQNGPIEELKTEDIRHSFETALNSEFRVVIVAPMSSGKSTLINAIVGKDLLPALNQATTAVITEIKDHDGMDKFVVSATSKDGQKICDNVEATKELITELNAKIDEKNGTVFANSIKIEGDIPNISSKKLSVVFVDTPGGNNSQNMEHMKTMDEAIESEDKSLILYVFNGTQLGTSDSNEILRKISSVMKKASNGKQTRDRFLFVANRMDNFDPDVESYEEAEKNILEMIHNNGIENPRLFFVSAVTAKLIRMKRNSEVFTKKEKTDLYGLVEYFNGDGSEKCSLDKFAVLSNDEKKRIRNEKKGLSDKLSEMDEDDVGYKKLQYRFAELQSGIPSLEAAINEYLEKYAIAIKMKALHDTFMGKVEERNMLYNFEQKVATSSAEYDSVCAALIQKQERLKKLNTVGDFIQRIKGVKPVDFSNVDEIKNDLMRKIFEKVNSLPEKIEVKECEYYVAELSNTLGKKLEESIRKIKEELENGLIVICENVVREYEGQIKKMDDEGIFQIGAFNFNRLAEFKKFQHIDINDLMRRKVTETVKVGTKKVEKDGIFAGIKRFFGFEGGWENKDVYGNKEYVLLQNFAKEELGEFNIVFDRDIDTKKEDVRRKEREIKNEVEKHLRKLQDYISDITKQIESTVGNRDELEKKVKEDADKRKWLKNFIEEIDSVLEI